MRLGLMMKGITNRLTLLIFAMKVRCQHFLGKLFNAILGGLAGLRNWSQTLHGSSLLSSLLCCILTHRLDEADRLNRQSSLEEEHCNEASALAI
jgi:hypothetical protein